MIPVIGMFDEFRDGQWVRPEPKRKPSLWSRLVRLLS